MSENEAVIDTIRRLGWKRVKILNHHFKDISFVKNAGKQGISATILTSDGHVEEIDNNIVVFSRLENAFQSVRKFLHQKNSVLLVDFDGSGESFAEFFARVDISAVFFRLSRNGLYRVQTFSRKLEKVIQTKWPVRKNDGGYYEEKFDLEGIELTTTNLDWMPYIRIFDCDERGLNCAAEGFNVEVTSIIGEMYNFTLNFGRANCWGSVPANGSYLNPDTVTFEGVFGDVVSGRSDVSLAAWKHTYERSLWVDFSQTITSSPVVIVTNIQRHPFDVYLFTRPFRRSAWLVTTFLVILTVGIVRFAKWLQPEGSDSVRIAVLSSWLFFVLISAFFSGAMTMFFSSTPKIPFTTVEEGIQRYPTWKLLVLTGLEVDIYQEAERGKKIYQEYWDLMQNSKGELRVSDTEEGVNRLLDAGNVLLTIRAQLPEFIRIDGLDLQELGVMQKSPNSFLLAHRSPLTIIFRRGLQKLQQSGALDLLWQKWKRRKEDQRGKLYKVALDIQHIAVVFILYSAVVALSTLICCLEAALEYIYKRVCS